MSWSAWRSHKEVLKLKKKIFTFLLVMKRNARRFSAEVQLQCLDTIVQVLLPWFLLEFCKFLLDLWRCVVKGTYRYHYLCLYSLQIWCFIKLLPVVGCDPNVDFPISIGWKRKIVSVGCCIPRNSCSLKVCEDQMEANESRRLVCA